MTQPLISVGSKVQVPKDISSDELAVISAIDYATGGVNFEGVIGTFPPEIIVGYSEAHGDDEPVEGDLLPLLNGVVADHVEDTREAASPVDALVGMERDEMLDLLEQELSHLISYMEDGKVRYRARACMNILWKLRFE